MIRRVALVRTDVSEERSASFIRATRIVVLGTTLAVTSNLLMMRRATRRNIPENVISSWHTEVLCFGQVFDNVQFGKFMKLVTPFSCQSYQPQSLSQIFESQEAQNISVTYLCTSSPPTNALAEGFMDCPHKRFDTGQTDAVSLCPYM
jgi:hypothetical protein